MQNAFFRRSINHRLSGNKFLADGGGVRAFIQKRNFLDNAFYTGPYRPVAQTPVLVL